MTYKKSLAVATLVAEAIEENIDSNIRITSNSVELTIWTGAYGPPFHRHAELAEAVTAILDHRIMRPEQWFWRAGIKSHHTVHRDMAALRGVIDGVSVRVNYLVPHIHGNYRGEFLDGKHRWTCGSCRERITITECRKIGLLPPLDRRKP